jgi:hypothetical protein
MLLTIIRLSHSARCRFVPGPAVREYRAWEFSPPQAAIRDGDAQRIESICSDRRAMRIQSHAAARWSARDARCCGKLNSKFRRSGFATADYPAFRIDPAIILRDHPLAMMSVLARAKGDPGRQATATALAIDYR